MGAVVEVEIEWTERAPLFEAGTTHRFFFGGTAPVEKARLKIDYPWRSVHVDHVIQERPVGHPIADRRHRRRPQPDQHESVEGGPFAARFPRRSPASRSETSAPRLHRLHDGRLLGDGGGGLRTTSSRPSDRQAGSGERYDARRQEGLDLKRDRDAIVGRLVARLGADVETTPASEFGEASIVPRPPAEVFERRYGDCKDKALLLTALLRSAGIAAEVALLDSGFGPDVDPDVPGFGSFDHAIVYLPGPRPLWIDATDRFSAVGELLPGDQGRLALVAARGTKALLRTPEAPSTVNLTRRERPHHQRRRGRQGAGGRDLGPDRLGGPRHASRLLAGPRRSRSTSAWPATVCGRPTTARRSGAGRPRISTT